MTLLLVWNFIQRFWIPLAVAAAFAFVMAWHFNAVRVAVKKNDIQWVAKNKANADAWIAKVREADDITHAKEIKFSNAVATINANRSKELNDAKITLNSALARVAAGNLVLFDNGPTSINANAGKTETETTPRVGDNATGYRLSDRTTALLVGQAIKANEVVQESNAVKALLLETYTTCSR